MPKITTKMIKEQFTACGNFTKFLMCVCLGLVCLIGLAITIFCGIALTDSSVFGDRLDIKGFTGLMVMGVVLGVLLIVVSVLGIFGYCYMNRCILVIVAIVIILLALLQIVCGVVGLVYKNDYHDLVEDAWKIADEGSRKYFEKKYHCCGGDNAADHPASDFCLNVTSSDSSSSFSSHENIFDFFNNAFEYGSGYGSDSSSEYKDGCVSTLADKAKDLMTSVGVGLIVATLIEIGIIAATIFIIVKIGQARGAYSQLQDQEDSLSVLDSRR